MDGTCNQLTDNKQSRKMLLILGDRSVYAYAIDVMH